MKKILMLSAVMFMSACAAQEVKPQQLDLSQIHNDVYVTCNSKLDHSELDYLKSQRHDDQSTIFNGFIISQVVDVSGKHWSINQTEWTNYICSEKTLP